MNAATAVASIRKLASQIAAPSSLIPGTVPSAWGAPHIEVDNFYHFVVCERGQELERRTTSDVDELNYWVFDTITFSMAGDWELTHRRPREDSRRQLFDRQRGLLIAVNPDWAARHDERIAKVLRNHPFDDAR